MPKQRVFQTRKHGERVSYPPKTVNVFNPLFVIEQKINDIWIPTKAVSRDYEEALNDSKELDPEMTRISVYQRVEEHG